MLVLVVSGCSTGPATVEFGPDGCEPRAYNDTGPCYHPDDCCALSADVMAAICAEHLPEHKTPVVCEDHAGVGPGCIPVVPEQRFACIGERAVLWCCPPPVTP